MKVKFSEAGGCGTEKRDLKGYSTPKRSFCHYSLYPHVIPIQFKIKTRRLVMFPLTAKQITLSSTVAKRAQRAENREKHLQIKKTAFVNLTTHTLQMLTTQPKKEPRCKANVFSCVVSICSVFLYVFVLWAFAVCFFICLCCEHLHHLLSNWWRWFLDFFYLHVFSEAAACWALSATIVKAQKSMKDIVYAFSAGWYSPKWRYGDATVSN